MSDAARPGIIKTVCPSRLGPTSARCNELLRRPRRKSDRKLSLIGWSLGGVYARELAKAMTDHVRCLITLSTPGLLP